MIRKMQSRFIRASMLAVVLVLFIIMGTINAINYYHVAKNADGILQLLADNNGIFPSSPDAYKPDLKPDAPGGTGQADSPGRPGSSTFMTDETPFESRFFSVLYDKNGNVIETNMANIAAIDTETAENYAASVRQSSSDSGFLQHFRYLRRTQDDGNTRVLFLDCQRSLGSFRSFLLTTVSVSLVGIAAVFVLVFLFSRRIVRPAEESYQKQKRFITDAGHELKTPLTIIDADVSVLEMDTGANEWIDDIRLQTARLTGLTNDLIFLSRMDEGSSRMQMIDFPLSDVVSDTAQSFRSRAQVEGKKFSTEIDPMLNYCGDEKSISKLVSILLDNALKYSDESGNIRLILKKSGRGILLTVYNTVDNVNTDTLAHMFDRFYRADASRNSSNAGYGIGLSIASAVVEAHKGKIKASSTDGRSLLISVTLPDS